MAGLAKERDKDRAKLDEKLKDKDSPMITSPSGRGHLPGVFSRTTRWPCSTEATPPCGAISITRSECPTPSWGPTTSANLGAGLGQALGAAAARPGKQVYCIIGDGAFGFHPQEIETAVRNELPVIFLVACDKQWGMVKMTQQIAFKPIKTMIKKSLAPEETINADLGPVEWNIVARAMGAHGERVQSPGGAAASSGALLCLGQMRRDPVRGGPGQAHVGPGSDALQENAPGTGRIDHGRW